MGFSALKSTSASLQIAGSRKSSLDQTPSLAPAAKRKPTARNVRRPVLLKASARVMLLMGVREEIEFTFSNYKKFQAESRIVSIGQ